MNQRTKAPIAVDTKTRGALSLSFIIATIPVKNPATPVTASITPGIASHKLSKNPIPPRCPLLTSRKKTPSVMKKATISPTDHFPSFVLGMFV